MDGFNEIERQSFSGASMIRWARREAEHAAAASPLSDCTVQPDWSTFRPRWFRLALAFLAAPIAASIFFGVVLPPDWGQAIGAIMTAIIWTFERASRFSLFALIFALPGSVILGGPLYALLIGRVRPRMRVAVFVGACIGVIIGVVGSGLTFGPPYLLLPGFPFIAASASAGGFGGIVFWLCAIWREPRLRFAARA